ncbi:MAG: hypothetical protein LIO96_05595 [Lachnospiraceae bacterium]|nr:hypothetical protein [Lachnospiraceae bacterium]
MISYFFLYAHTLQPDQHGFLSEDVIHSLYENPKYQANLNSQGSPFLLHDDVFGTTLSYDIYEQNVFLCRIILDDIIRPFMPYDGELLLFFSEFVREKYLEMDNSIDTKGSALGIFFTQALDDQISTSTEKLLPLLVPFNWDVTDHYLCLCIHISYKRIGESGTGYYQSVLTRNLPDVYTFSYNDNLIVLVNIDHAYKGG